MMHVIKDSNITSRDEITLYSICKLLFSGPFSPISELDIVDNAFYFMKQVLFIQICVKSVTLDILKINQFIVYWFIFHPTMHQKMVAI